MHDTSSGAGQRQRDNALREVVEAVRARAGHRDATEVEAMLSAELAARGLVQPRSAVAWRADLLVREREPLGRVMTFARGLGIFASGIWDSMTGLRHPLHTGPAWLARPDRAAFPMIEGDSDQAVAVLPDDDAAAAVIARAHAEGRRMGPMTEVDVWFSTDEDTAGGDAADGDPVAVHVGQHRVGTIRGADAQRFAAEISAAAAFDEAPYLRASIMDMPGGRPALLEVRPPPDPHGLAAGPTGSPGR
jgi:hypothetical protein